MRSAAPTYVRTAGSREPARRNLRTLYIARAEKRARAKYVWPTIIGERKRASLFGYIYIYLLASGSEPPCLLNYPNFRYIYLFICLYIIGERSEPPLSVELSEFSLYLYIYIYFN